MKKLVIAVALAAAAGVGATNRLVAHGGTYAGPGDVVPPGGGGTGGGGTGGVPGSGGPTGPGGPTTPGGARPSTPGGGGGGGGGPITGGGGGIDTALDLTRWQFWWELNREFYLDLKRHLFEQRPITDSDEYFLNGGRDVARDDLRPAPRRIRQFVAPALMAVLERESSNDMLTSALIGLAKIGDERDESGRSPTARRIATFLTHANQEVAETAALALGILGDEREVELLAALLGDDRATLARLGIRTSTAVNDRTRAFAAFALGLLGERAGEEALQRSVRALSAPLAATGSFAKRDVPVACVLALGLVALPPAPADVALGDARGATELAFREQQIAWLLERFSDRGIAALIRAHMPRSIAQLATSLDGASPVRARVVQTLLASLAPKADDRYVQQSCVLALGQLGDCDADELDTRIRVALMRAQGDNPDQQVKRFALIALAQVCGRAGLGAEPFAGLAVKKNGPREFLLQHLDKGQSDERCWAALALGVLERALDDQRAPSSAETRTALRFAFGAATAADEVGACAVALGIARDHFATEPLLERLSRVADPDARGYVALALGMIGDDAAIEPVRAVVAKAKYQPELLRSGATALGLLGDNTISANLVDMLGGASALSSQAAIAKALGLIGDARSIDPLTAMLGDESKTALARAFAAAALGIVGDKDAHPWVARYALQLNYRASTETLTAPDGGTGLLQLL